ncbi:MAG: hypothetical protein E7507_01360 [Ruminococcus sp.]|nr:hypothetical protein [Ruminococcus sp.]
MSLIFAIRVKIQQLLNLPHYLVLHIKDLFFYFLHKDYKKFNGWGLHLFIGMFGAGKTSTMVYRAYQLAKKYPELVIITNMMLSNFPKHTQILKLNGPQDIINAPNNSLILIDEIGTIFNSRDFAKSKESVPKSVFQLLCQCRHKNIMIYGTVQRWCFLDKQLRDITATVTVTSSYAKHPFSRMMTCRVYDSFEYDTAYSNPMVPLVPLDTYVYIQTDKIRKMYDTRELINNMLKADYISDKEILENRGITPVYQYYDLKSKAKRFSR